MVIKFEIKSVEVDEAGRTIASNDYIPPKGRRGWRGVNENGGANKSRPRLFKGGQEGTGHLKD
jgi:hypothetical protein